MRSTKKGFTLLELMIVAAIIAIILALALPALLRARMGANEASAVSSVRLIATSEVAFCSSVITDANGDGLGDYGTLGQLSNPDGAGVVQPFIDTHLGAGVKSGYTFTIQVFPGTFVSAPGYICTATPLVPGRTGVKNFYVDERATVRFTADGTPASDDSMPIS